MDWEVVVTPDIEGSVCESEAARLLPWYVAGTLAAADVERVTRHLEHCGVCRADLAHERGVRAAMKAGAANVEYAPQAGLERTLARIDELTREAPAAAIVPATRAARRITPTQWLAAAVVVQAVGLGVLGASVVGRPAANQAPAAYQTLSSPAPVASGARIRAVFAPSTPVDELRALLGANRLAIVSGPSEAGVFTLASLDSGMEPARLDALITALRRSSSVAFAEPAHDASGAPR
jgi:hypothetical protein